MRIPSALAVSAGLIVAGCGAESPASRLGPGAKVVLINAPAAPGMEPSGHSDRVSFVPAGSHLVDMELVDRGTPAEVLVDDADEPGGTPGFRWTRVRIGGGPKEGKVGDVWRRNLKPMAR